MAVRGNAVVTGAAGGLGTQIARQLANRGWAVHLTDRDGAALDRVTTRIEAEHPGAVTSSALDVRDEAACSALAGELASRPGGLTLWVNNAGVLETSPAWAADEARRRLLVDVNVHGTMNGTVAALEIMRPARVGHVVNIVSLAGLVAAPGETVYSATKHAALAFSVGTNLDLRQARLRGVRVSAICPDGIWTPMLFDRIDDPQAAPSWSGRLLAPAEVARVVADVAVRPQPVRSVPRSRGVVRVYAAAPRLAYLLAPTVLKSARRRQAAFAAQVRAGKVDREAPLR